MNSYEMLYILDNDLSDEMKEKLVNKFNDIIVNANGTIDTVDKWGTKKLAYDINYKSEGYYVLINFKAQSDLPNELERVMRITDGVVRFIVLKK
ncbi:MAG: 30S ribosomal protein S6 [Clostridia bacterium]|nr:30S ribosomal protein S6 [Clostridia bacterium]